MVMVIVARVTTAYGDKFYYTYNCIHHWWSCMIKWKKIDHIDTSIINSFTSCACGSWSPTIAMSRWLRNTIYAVLIIIFLFTIVNNLQTLFAGQKSLAMSSDLAAWLLFPSVTICAHKRTSDFVKENNLIFLKHKMRGENGWGINPLIPFIAWQSCVNTKSSSGLNWMWGWSHLTQWRFLRTDM